MVKRLLATLFVLAIAVGCLLLIGLIHAQLASGSLPLASVVAGSSFLQLMGTYFLGFIAILVLRYLLLMLMSFIEHLRAAAKDRDEALRAQVSQELPLVSIVVPAFNEELLIQAALRSLLRLDYPRYEVIVVDDGSTDDTYTLALEVARQSLKVPVQVIRKRNAGKAMALNAGLMRARGDFVLNMDADTKLSADALRVCVRHFRDPRLGAVAGNVKVFNRENTLTWIQALEYVEGLAMARKAQSLLRLVNIIPGPLGMFRKSALTGVGGYDNDTFAEDCDLTLKLLMQGWQVVYEERAQAWVETPSGLLDLLKQRYRWTRGILQAMRKHRHMLWEPEKSPKNCLILWYMLFESILWPISSVLGSIFFASIGLLFGSVSLVLFWWIQLTLLDLMAATYCVTVERERPRLIPYAVLFRVFFISIIDIAKVMATVEETLGVKMNWGKLQREGKL
jgi:biofilm PGA synthesis N-glycosyltransferase PgaC